jgi:hypothetical protein
VGLGGTWWDFADGRLLLNKFPLWNFEEMHLARHTAIPCRLTPRTFSPGAEGDDARASVKLPGRAARGYRNPHRRSFLLLWPLFW